MLNIFIVGLGGFFGAISRYLLSLFISHQFDKALLPYGTMVVNLLGCFLIGFIISIGYTKYEFSSGVKLLVLVGFLGGFTTFSSFELEAFELIKQNHIMAAMIDVVAQVVVGLISVWGGFILGMNV